MITHIGSPRSMCAAEPIHRGPGRPGALTTVSTDYAARAAHRRPGHAARGVLTRHRLGAQEDKLVQIAPLVAPFLDRVWTTDRDRETLIQHKRASDRFREHRDKT